MKREKLKKTNGKRKTTHANLMKYKSPAAIFLQADGSLELFYAGDTIPVIVKTD